MAEGPNGRLKELYFYPSFQYFTWEEYVDGQRILKEKGPMFGAGAAVLLESPKLGGGSTLTFKAKAELFGSEVDYDGTAQNLFTGETFPASTDVTYFGTKGEIDVGWRHTSGPYYLEPFAGAGIRWWLRDLQDGTAVDNSGNTVQVSGGEEYWFSAYARAGLRSGYQAKDVKFFAEAGAKYPFHNENTFDSPFGGELTLEPKAEWSAFAEIGMQYKWFRPSIFYEGFRYRDSEPVGGFYQPRSDSDIIGLNLGFAFR
jgi:hypothetical protein